VGSNNTAVKRLQWVEPRWSWQPQLVAELRRARLLSVRFWLRIGGFAYGVLLAILTAAFLAIPGLQVPLRIYFAPCGLAIVMLTPLGVQFLFSRRIKVWDGNVILMHGSAGVRIDPGSVISSQLDASDPTRVHWNIEFRTRRGREKIVSIGVPPSVDLVKLTEAAGPLLDGSSIPRPPQILVSP
jgi:hypothetical protein